MSKRDTFHYEAKNALIKDGWTITDDPFLIRYDDTDMYADLGAEKLIAAQKEKEKIVVEVKSFTEGSLVSQFHMAVGQFIDYKICLEEIEPERILFLAVPFDAFHTFFRKRLAQTVIKRFDIRIIVFDVKKEEIARWIK